MIFFLYLFGIFLSLFILYSVARHDFVLLRQSISLRQVFDSVLLSLISFFIFGRISYAYYIRSIEMLNPLRFFHLIKYWGIMPFIGFFGMIIMLLFLFRRKKNKLRILDIYTISFTPLIILDVVLKSNHGIFFILKIVSLVVLLLFYGWFIKIHNKFSTKDGFITFITIITYSLVTLAFSLASFGIFKQRYLWLNVILVISIFCSSVFLLLIQKDRFNKQ